MTDKGFEQIGRACERQSFVGPNEAYRGEQGGLPSTPQVSAQKLVDLALELELQIFDVFVLCVEVAQIAEHLLEVPK